jgi:hypothetical protein
MTPLALMQQCREPEALRGPARRVTAGSVAYRKPSSLNMGTGQQLHSGSPWRSSWTAMGMVKPVGPTLTQDQRPSLTTGTPEPPRV